MCSPCSAIHLQPEDVLSALLATPDGLSDRGVAWLVRGQADEIRKAVRLLQATGRIVSASRPGGERVWVIGGVPGPEEPAPTTQHARILSALGEHPDGLSALELESLVGGSVGPLRATLRALVASGKASEWPGQVWKLGAGPDKALLVAEERALATLRKHPGGLSGRKIEALVGGPARQLRAGLKALHAAGKVTAAPRRTRGGGTLWKIA